jgi:hypothetical protein
MPRANGVTWCKTRRFIIDFFTMIPDWYLLDIIVNFLKNKITWVFWKRETIMGIALFVLPTCGFWWIMYLPLTLPEIYGVFFCVG